MGESPTLWVPRGARLKAMTIAETMLYKEFLGRVGHPLNESEERQKAERKKDKRKRKGIGDSGPQAENEDSETDDEREEEQVMIDWALEWWQKPGAPIVT